VLKYLSIIIPHYNSPDRLRLLLETIPDNENIETIVIDDNSTSEMEKYNDLVDTYRDVLFLKTPKTKKGAGASRNIGLERAQGKWILFADSDDLFAENMYSKINSYFKSESDVIFFKPTSLDIKTSEKSDRHKEYEELIVNYQNNKNLQNETKLRYEFWVPWSKMISRDLIIDNDISFDEILASNDVMFSTNVGYYMETFEVSEEVIYCVTEDSGSLTKRQDNDIFLARFNAYLDYCVFIKDRLPKEQLQYLNLHGGTRYIVNAIVYHRGLQIVLLTIKKLRVADLPLFKYRYLNPFYVMKLLFNFKKPYD